MNIIESIFMGIVQGVTEFLPVSSSGHLAIYQSLTGLEPNLLNMTLMHMGTLLAVILCFRKSIGRLLVEFVSMVKDIFGGRFKWREMNGERRTIVMLVISSAMLIPFVLPLIPAGGEMQSIKDIVAPATNGSMMWLVGLCLIITAGLLFVADYLTRKKPGKRTVATTKDAVTIGLAQGLAAALPGVSRSGSTTSTGLILGLNKKYAAEYSFILSIPAVLAANVLELGEAISSDVPAADTSIIGIILGIITAFVTGVLAIRIFMWLIKKNKYWVFAIYCAAVGAMVFFSDIILRATR